MSEFKEGFKIKSVLFTIAFIACGLIGISIFGKLGFFTLLLPFGIWIALTEHNWGSALGLTVLFVLAFIVIGLNLLLAIAR